MTLLSRYLMRQNLFLTFAILLMGTGIYVLTDLFERLDNFLESPGGVHMLFVYLGVKIPAIISMILPAVYMLSMVAQLNFLERNRELIALKAGGVSPIVLFRFVFVYGLVWAVAQFAFAQFIGVAGERMAYDIWLENVRGTSLDEASISGLWFTEDRHIVHIGKVFPRQGKGDDILIYTLDSSGVGIEAITRAKRFSIADETHDTWLLEEGNLLRPAEYAGCSFDRMEIGLKQDMTAFQVSGGRGDGGVKPAQLTLVELYEIIKRLESAGSNVEDLRAALHGKIAYACSITVMGLLALVISRLTGNIYKAVAASLLIIFLYYAMNTVSASMGGKGVLYPELGAWLANIIFLLTALVALLGPTLWRKVNRL